MNGLAAVAGSEADQTLSALKRRTELQYHILFKNFLFFKTKNILAMF